jgi:CRISPR-associated endonuclease/helicase Cas3
VGGPEPLARFAGIAERKQYAYSFEPWTAHAERTVEQARLMAQSCLCGAEALARRHGVSRDLVESLVELVCALHDTGKLSAEWQKVAWRWQDERDRRACEAGITVPERPRVPLAHTWYEPEVDRERRPKFPPHAVEGAFAVCEAVGDRLAETGGDEWAGVATICAATAIARHHTSRASECKPFQLVQAACDCAVRAAGAPRLTIHACTSRDDGYQLGQQLLSFSRQDDSQLWDLFVLLERRLRLADQKATRLGRVGSQL